MQIKTFQELEASVQHISPSKACNIAKGAGILVTGGTGFLGSHICTQLSQTGEKVILLSRHKKPREAFETQTDRYNLKPNFNNITFVVGDVSLPNWGLTTFPSIKHVIHSAAELNVVKTYKQLQDTNTFSVLPLIPLMHAGIKCTHLSTLSVFASSNYKEKYQDECIPDPTLNNLRELKIYGGYAQSKLTAEILLINYAPQSMLDIIRLPLIVGPINPDKDLLPRFITIMTKINYLPAYTPKEELNQVDIKKATDAVLAKTEQQIRHYVATSNTSLAQVLQPLALKVDEEKFRRNIKKLTGIDKALVMNAFFKPQALKYFNFDLFHSTGLKFKT